jgi:predicted XRE-type DNA-binding protein
MPESKQNASNPNNENDMEWVKSSGNVYTDLGFSDDEAAKLLVRSELILMVKTLIRERGWTQQESASQLGVHQPRVSDCSKVGLATSR